jgi:ABC-type cobalamin/Fe3+-siderophores transport system ATPase subunit
MNDQSVALEARNVSKRYRKVWALRECSFQLPAGGIIALVGTNGAGKSTLMSIIAGMLPATAGTLLVNGHPVVKGRAAGAGGSTEAGSRVAILAQDKPLYRDFSVADMLRFGRSANRVWDQQRALSWLERFDVPLDRRCGKLSGGQRTQVALAVTLASCPAVLLLDEPLSNLDPVARTQVNLFDSSGHELDYAALQRICPDSSDPNASFACLVRNHLQTHTLYQPASRIPVFHLILASGYLGLAVIALAAVWLIVRRTNLSAG